MASNKPGSYHPMPEYIAQKIRYYLNRLLVAFWVINAETDAFLLFDFESMQQFNVSTGYRRSIRCRKRSAQTLSGKRKWDDMDSLDSGNPTAIDLTNSSNFAPISSTQNPTATAASPSASLVQPPDAHAITQNVIPKCKNCEHSEVCGPAYETPFICGSVARIKLDHIRALQLSRCQFIQDMRSLPQESRLFNPEPISEEDKRFPMAQVKHLGRGGITVHDILPSATWARNRRYFDLLYNEENALYAAHSTTDGPAKIKHFAWHGAPAECIRGILEYGFLVGPTPRVGNRYGHGIYLSTETYGRYSMNHVYSQPDLAGFKFLLLCEVLPGTVEASTSGQTRPSNLSLHSGVDKLPGATMHVFYTFDMNVRICPKYLVVVHPPVTEAVMNLVPNEFQVPTVVLGTDNEANDMVIIDCT